MQVSDLCGPQFPSYLPKHFTYHCRGLYGDAIFVYTNMAAGNQQKHLEFTFSIKALSFSLESYNLGRNKMEQQTPIPPQIKDEVAQKPKRAIFLSLILGGGGGLGFPFIVSNIVAYVRINTSSNT